MVTARLVHRGSSFSLAVWGHAGAGVKGQDIVCAGVSVLVHMGAQRLLDIQEALEQAPRIILEPGQALLAAEDKEGGIRARELFQAVMTGLYQLAQQYPQYVAVQEGP